MPELFNYRVPFLTGRSQVLPPIAGLPPRLKRTFRNGGFFIPEFLNYRVPFLTEWSQVERKTNPWLLYKMPAYSSYVNNIYFFTIGLNNRF